jgi:cation transport ATPase
MVGDSQARRAPDERVIERFARWYTPAILALALGVSVLGPLLSARGWPYQPEAKVTPRPNPAAHALPTL